MAYFQDLTEEERYVLYALYRIVGRSVGRKPRHAPVGEVMRKLAPGLRDTTAVRKALKSLERRGLARRVKPGARRPAGP